MHKLRLIFTKIGPSIFISHLDLMQVLSRAITRAGFHLKFSEGFNPHPVMSVLFPLSVGTESVCEMVDIKLLDYTDSEDFISRINPALPEGLKVLKVVEDNTMDITKAKWLWVEGDFYYDNPEITKDAARNIQELFDRDEVTITKQGKKKKLSQMDIKQGINCFECRKRGDRVHISAKISVAEPVVAPKLLVQAVNDIIPVYAPDFSKFYRIEIYDSEMNLFR